MTSSAPRHTPKLCNETTRRSESELRTTPAAAEFDAVVDVE